MLIIQFTEWTATETHNTSECCMQLSTVCKLSVIFVSGFKVVLIENESMNNTWFRAQQMLESSIFFHLGCNLAICQYSIL